jgi:uncharacterized lipoprotein YmbA
MLNKHLNQFILLCAGGLLSACAATPPTHFYTLESQNQSPVATTTAIAKKPLIGIGPLSLPPLLDRKQIITRTEDNSLQIAEFDQWASPLKDNILAVLSKNVAALQPNAMVRAYPWSAYGNSDYHVIVDITRFDTQLGQSVNLEASWAIMEEKNHTIIGNGQIKIQQPLIDAGYAGATQALSKLLGKFSQQLSQALTQAQQASPAQEPTPCPSK